MIEDKYYALDRHLENLKRSKEMGISYEKVLSEFSPKQQKRIKKESARRIQQYKSLQKFRTDIGLTQEELAGRLTITQKNVSRLEHREDMHLLTLRKYVEALGCKLEISILIPERRNAPSNPL